MMQRMMIVMLSIVLLITACEQSGLREFDDIPLDELGVQIRYNFTPQIHWASPNPGERWHLAGRELTSNNASTRILLDISAKETGNQALESALETLITADNYTIETTEDGIVYARGTNRVSNYIIYRDYPNFVVTLTMVDALSDEVAPLYISDWEIIALEGSLLILE